MIVHWIVYVAIVAVLGLVFSLFAMWVLILVFNKMNNSKNRTAAAILRLFDVDWFTNLSNKKKAMILGGLVGALGVALGILPYISREGVTDEVEYTPEITRKIRELDQVKESLNSLVEFVEEQKTTIQREQEAIQALAEEKAGLEPVVAMNREVVDKIFEMQEKRNSKKKIVDMAVGFILGVIGSIIASIIVSRVKKTRQNTEV